MNRSTHVFLAMLIGVGLLALVSALLSTIGPAMPPVYAQSGNLRCDFYSITGMAALGIAPGISDTMPGSDNSRILYFSNPAAGVITLTVTLTDLHPGGDPCYLWSGPAWGTPLREYTATIGNPTVVLTYPVDQGSGFSPVVLTSSQFITGSMYAQWSQQRVLTFTRDITPPEVSDPAIHTLAEGYLCSVDTTLYYTDTGMAFYAFTITGRSTDDGAGLWKTTFAALADSQPPDSWASLWSAKYLLGELPFPGVLTATSYDYVGNSTSALFHYKPDDQPPTSVATATLSVSYGKAPIPVRWEAQDRECGVREVALYFRSPVHSDWTRYATATVTSITGTFSFVPPTVWLTGPITYEFASVATDRLRNTEGFPSAADSQVVVQPVPIYLPLVLRNYPPAWNRGSNTTGQFRSPAFCGNNVWYAGTWDNGVWKSTDNAQNWNQVIQERRNPYPVVPNPANCNEAFVSVWGNGVYRISGSSATQINNNLGDLKVYGLAITGTTLYAGTNAQGVFKTDINNINWQAINNGITEKRIRSLFVLGNEIYAGARACKLYVSSSGGQSWSEQTVLTTGCDDAQVWSIARVGNTLYAGLGMSKGLYARTGAGNWNKVTVIPDRTVFGLAYDGATGVLYVSAYGAGVYRCPVDEQGMVTGCIPHNIGLSTLNTRELGIGGGRLVVGSDDGIWYLPLFR